MGGGSKTTNVQQPASMSPEVQQLLAQTTPQQIRLIEQNPLVSFGAANPQGVAGLTSEQHQIIQLLTSLGVDVSADPGSPFIPATPGTPGSPGTPGTPGTPGSPAVEETPGHWVGRATNSLAGSVPDWIPGVPGRPAVAAIPGTPGTPAIAAIPGTPAVAARPGHPAGTAPPLLRPDELRALAYAQGQAGAAGGGDIGNAPATRAAREAINAEFTNFTRPQIESELNLAGLGRSGALGDAMAKASAGNAAALVPFLTNEANLQQNAGLDYVRALTGAGATEEQRATARPQTAFAAQEALRGNEQQMLDAAFQDFLRRENLTENVVNAGNAWVPSSFGRTTNADTRGGGLLGALFGGSAKSFVIPFVFSLFAIAHALI